MKTLDLAPIVIIIILAIIIIALAVYSGYLIATSNRNHNEGKETKK